MRLLGLGLFSAVGLCFPTPTQGQDQNFPQSGQRGRLFSLPRAQDDIFEWTQANEDIRSHRYAEAVERLQTLLHSGSHGVVPLDSTGERFHGLRMAVITTLRELPAEGLAAYEKLTQREAASLLRRAFEGGRNEDLPMLARSFPTSEAGLRARIRLGDLCLEAGDGIGAAAHYLQARDGVAETSPLHDALDSRRAAARALSRRHLREPTRELRLVTTQIQKLLPGDTNESLIEGWPSYGNGGSPGRAMRAPPGNAKLMWQRQVRPSGFEGSLYPMHAIGGLRSIFVNDGAKLMAFDALNGELMWDAKGPMAETADSGEYERSINPDVVLTAACNDAIVVAALQVPGIGESQRFRHIDVIRKIPARRLFAFDRTKGGKLLWGHWDHERDRWQGHDAAGPPLIYGDTVIVPSHDQTGAIAYYLSCYELKTGQLLWRRLICSSQGEVNMFGNARKEFAAAPLTIDDGIIYGTTNLGVCFAADARTGDLRWITAYEVIPLPPTRLTGQQAREAFFANSPPSITDGVIACMPLDSAYALGIDMQTGTILWRVYYRIRGGVDLRWLLGSMDDEFFFGGLGVLAVKARPGSDQSEAAARVVRGPESLGLDQYGRTSIYGIPLGALTSNRIYFSTPDGIKVFDKDGDTDPSSSDLDTSSGSGLGNLLLVDGLLISIRNGAISAHYDEAQLVEKAERNAEKHKDDAAAILLYASLLRARAGDDVGGQKGDKAELWYRKGLDVAKQNGMGISSPTYRRLATDLFALILARAQILAQQSPGAAAELLGKAREQTIDEKQWIEAQRRRLELLENQPAAYLRELDLMAARHGNVLFRFPGIGRVPTAVFALWQGALHAQTPRHAIERLQDLMENFSDILIGGQPVRQVAAGKQAELIKQHGREIYAPIEKRAGAALERAPDDPELLRALAQQFPHSLAARTAIKTILDLAVRNGDLATAAEAFARALREGAVGGGMLRRMTEAARVAGNLPLARAFANRLLRSHADEISDFHIDGGQRMRDAISLPKLPELTKPLRLKTPRSVIATLNTSVWDGIPIRICDIKVEPTFGQRSDLPCYVSTQGRELRAYDTSKGASMFDEPLFSVPYQYLSETDQLLLCDETLLLPELSRVKAIHYQTGEHLWAFEESDDRMIISLGIQEGVLHLFSEMRNAGDGGRLIGIEPITGTVLFRRIFPIDRESIPPTSSHGGLWVLDESSDHDHASIEHIDPLTGFGIRHTPLKADLLRQLKIDAARLQPLLHRMYADEKRVYIPIDGLNEERPRVAAINHEGETLWIWSGEHGRALEMVASTDKQTIIIESGNEGSQALVLDSRVGSVISHRKLGRYARALNWSRAWGRQTPCPETLLIVHIRHSLEFNIDCISLDGKSPSFSHPLSGDFEHVEDHPIFGEDFLALPVRRPQGAGVLMFVLDLKTRESLLSSRAHRLQLEAPYRMRKCGSHIALESAQKLLIFGENDR